MIHTITLKGHCPSLKNTMRHSHKHVYRDANAQSQIDGLIAQARLLWAGKPPLESPVIVVRLYVRDRRVDPNNQWGTIFDVLVRAGILRNDSVRHGNGIFMSPPAEVVSEQQERTEIVLMPCVRHKALWGSWLTWLVENGEKLAPK